MNATSSGSVLRVDRGGRAAGHMTAKSARIHSSRVWQMMPTRSSGSRPSESRPAASDLAAVQRLGPGE